MVYCSATDGVHTWLSGLLGAISWVSLATVVHTPMAATVAIALGSLSVAISDVIVDSLVVERAGRISG